MPPSASPFDEYSQLLELVQFAVRKEQEATDFYRSLLPRLASETARETVNGLARMEEDHKDRLERLNVAEVASRLSGGITGLTISDYETPSEARPDLSPRQLMEIAIGREVAAWKLYFDMAALIPDSLMKQLLETLAGEEARHREQLERLVKSEL